MPKKIRPVISLILLIIALAAGAFYVAGHHALLKQLSRTPPLTSLIVLALYIAMFGVLVLILSATLKICQVNLKGSENSLLNSHSLFINFFVPGQGGPAYRGLYLYKKHQLRVKNYIIATLLYYAIYAVVSVCLLLVGSRPWWQTILAVGAAAAVSWGVIQQYTKRAQLDKNSLKLSATNLSYLTAVTVLQTIVQATIYAVELHSVNKHITISQVITYTGAANLALFVSLTPGAIGIRESFLIFTERLHHISSANIIIANIIDRSVYLIFLLILLIITFGWHIKNKQGSVFKLI
jgi:uncharacterized membrane protein YbhN (UPF0104 family)